MEVDVAPVLHNKVPVKLLAVSNDVPQFLVTVTVGVEGKTWGAAVPTAPKLEQPVTVLDWVTV